MDGCLWNLEWVVQRRVLQEEHVLHCHPLVFVREVVEETWVFGEMMLYDTFDIVG